MGTGEPAALIEAQIQPISVVVERKIDHHVCAQLGIEGELHAIGRMMMAVPVGGRMGWRGPAIVSASAACRPLKLRPRTADSCDFPKWEEMRWPGDASITGSRRPYS